MTTFMLKLLVQTEPLLFIDGKEKFAAGINGENRIIVKNAIKSINDKCENLGIRALLSEAKLTQGQIDEDSIGFAIVPRINSAGRIDSALLAVRLYMSKNEIEAKTYASKLNQLNYQRQEMVKSIYESSLKQSESQIDDNVIVTYDEGWDVGVIGIVASRLVDDFSKPAIVIAALLANHDAAAACFINGIPRICPVPAQCASCCVCIIT